MDKLIWYAMFHSSCDGLFTFTMAIFVSTQDTLHNAASDIIHDVDLLEWKYLTYELFLHLKWNAPWTDDAPSALI